MVTSIKNILKKRYDIFLKVLTGIFVGVWTGNEKNADK
jgi:hypothetical protein